MTIDSNILYPVTTTLIPSCARLFAGTGPTSPNLLYRVMFKRWEKICYLRGNTEAMREAGRKYLPQEPGEKDKNYEKRLKRSTLYGVYNKTVKFTTDLPFLTPPIYEGIPDELKYLIQDADGQGSSLSTFAKSVLNDLIDFGVAYIYVDFPENPEGLSFYDTQKKGMKPYFVRVSPLNLIGWDLKRVANRTVITKLRIFEENVVEAKDYSPFTQCTVKIITPDTVRTLTKGSEDKDYVQVGDDNPNGFSGIPLVPLYANKKYEFYGTPVFEELADLNIKHWYKWSDLDNVEHVACVPFLLGTGWGPNPEIEDIGVGRAYFGPGESKLGWVTVDGESIPYLQESLGALEHRMISMGADALMPVKTSTRQTATGELVDEKRSASTVAHLVWVLEEAIQKGINYCAKWLQIEEPNAKINIGDKLALSTDPNIVSSFLDMFKNDYLTARSLEHELRRRNIISDSTKIKKPRKKEVLVSDRAEENDPRGVEETSRGFQEGGDGSTRDGEEATGTIGGRETSSSTTGRDS